jgi:succinyl-diaminopimelate desuccinylase
MERSNVNPVPEIAASILDAVDASRSELVELCRTLVAAPSVNPPCDTRAAFGAAARYLSSHGLTYETHLADDTMPNLVAHVDGGRPGPQLVFNGHLDTMDPGDESRWTVPIFELTRRDGRLYGLGMGNMKGGVAALCLAMKVLAEHRAALAGRATLTLVSDEVRFGENGTALLLDTVPTLRRDAVVSAEGSGWMTMAVAEKGVAWLDLDTVGPAGHASAATMGETAAARLAYAIVALDALNDWYVEPPDELAGFLGVPEHPGRRVAVNTGIIEAGQTRSMLAPRASARVDIRLPPGLSLDALDNRISEVLRGTGVAHRRVRGWAANWTDTDNPLVRTMADAILRARGAAPEHTVRHPASDVMRWRMLGTPAVCYGPQPTFSAGIDDYAVEDDVIDCAKIYALTALGFASAQPSQFGDQL